MLIHRVVVGALAVNCYIIENPQNSQAVVIDPGAEFDKIMRCIEEQDLTVKAILLTHGHYDHIGAVDALKKATKAEVYVHEAEAAYLDDGQKNLSVMMGGKITAPYDYVVKEGDQLQLAKLDFEVIHTPGHTPGGTCYKMGDALFTGDTLFQGTMGRTDFPGGSYAELMASIKNKLKPLDDNIHVYPGHGADSTIGIEKQSNPAMLDNLWDAY